MVSSFDGNRKMKGIKRAFFILFIVGVNTFLLGELFARFVLQIPPLTNESLVWEKHDRWGWFHTPDAEGEFVKISFKQQININSRGLRERDLDYAKPGALKRIFVVGDSTVVGFEVPDTDTFPRSLERELNVLNEAADFQVINGGVRGYGTDQALLLLEEEGMKYSPDIVLYKWTGNDYDDNRTIHRPFRKFGKPSYAWDGEELVLKGAPVPDYPYSSHFVLNSTGEIVELPVSNKTRLNMWIRDNVVSRSSFVTAVVTIIIQLDVLSASLKKSGSFQGEGPSTGENDWVFQTAVALITRMREVAEQQGAKFYIVGFEKDIAGLAEASASEFLDPNVLMYGWLEEQKLQHRVPFDGHFNSVGNALYGKALAIVLNESLSTAQ